MRLKFDFVSSATLDGKSKKSRINFILNRVKDGTIMVTDGVMKPDEEMELIKETMRRVDDGFPGIEVASLKKPVKGLERLMEGVSDQREKIRGFLAGLAGAKAPDRSDMRNGLTLIGPAKFIKQVKKNPNSFSVTTEV